MNFGPHLPTPPPPSFLQILAAWRSIGLTKFIPLTVGFLEGGVDAIPITIHLSFFRHAFRIQKNVFDKGIDTETKVNTLNA